MTHSAAAQNPDIRLCGYEDYRMHVADKTVIADILVHQSAPENQRFACAMLFETEVNKCPKSIFYVMKPGSSFKSVISFLRLRYLLIV
jgi:hypothetical protein